MMPEDTAVFDSGSRDMRFVHGGNSLQERLIPVLTIEHREKPGGSTQQFKIIAQQLQGVAGLHCLEIQVKTVEQLALSFGSRNRIELALQCPDAPNLQVELIQARGSAQLNGSVIQAPVGELFELFFRLSGTSQEKVRVEVFHPSATDQVSPCIPEARFLVSALSTAPQRPSEVSAPDTQPAPATIPESAMPQWLEDLSEDGKIRQLFAHLAAHGAITEPEVAAMLGSPRAARRFSLQVDALASRAPFSVRVVMVGEVKRYVKEQS